MNWDLLECKKRAKELVGLDTPPCNENGTKKGYIEVMKQLWEEKGYENLGTRSQNIQDQASRLEKMEHGTVGKSQEDGVLGCVRERDDLNEGTIDMISQQELEPRNHRNESQHFNYEEASSIEPRYANYATVSQDLHTTTTLQQIPGDSPDQTAERPNHTIEKSEDNCPAPGSVPDYVSVCKPETIKWGKRIDGSEIVLQTSFIADAYNKIATWRKMFFSSSIVKQGETL